MRPAGPALVLLGAWLGLGLAAAFWTGAGNLWAGTGVAVAALLVADGLGVRGETGPEAVRRLPANLALGAWIPVDLHLHNRGQRPYALLIHDHHPADAEVAHQPAALELPPERPARLRYRLRPTRRGELHFGPVEVRLRSRLRLWRRHLRVGEPQAVRVFPDYAETVKYALLASDDALAQLGIRQRQRRGQGLEFHQLREYREGDSLRQVDWKASARHDKLIAREYQDEQDQQVVFVLDCGRRMRSEEGGRSHFDLTLNALLLLGYVALRQGDAVGFLTVGGPRRWAAPAKGMATLNRLLNRLYDLEPTAHGSDFVTAGRELARRQRKRALLVFLTNIRDEDSDELLLATRLLGRNHLVLVANLREELLDSVLDAPVNGPEQALRYAAAADFLNRRDHVHDRIRRSGAFALDVTPSELPGAVINQYLDIKRSGHL
ncbi:MAG TPA: DUF58 domain-containing protein [Gammaproteobacteria bacterium]|nr:DUF58 domain-containing protein [Gammaproteobacteria bacterium]